MVWLVFSSLPEINDLLAEFQTFLLDQKLKAEIKEKKSKNKSKSMQHTRTM
jgi:hypothetical protein